MDIYNNTDRVSILDLYIGVAKEISTDVFIDYADAKTHNTDNEYTLSYYTQNYVSKYVFKDILLEQHYQLVGYLSLMSNTKCSSDEIINIFNLDECNYSFENQKTSSAYNIMSFMDDLILNITYKVLTKLVEKEIKRNTFK